MKRLSLNTQSIAIISILLVAGTLFTWSALHNGWMNDYYSAAAVSGVSGWKAFFYASFDSASFISVDKLPLTTWLSAASVWLFGVSPLAVALPHIIAGIVTVYVLYRTVLLVGSHRLAKLAASLFLLTPIVPVIFGYNQPDSLFVALVVASLYAYMRLLQTNATSYRWSAVLGFLLGGAFMAKTLQIAPVLVAYGAMLLIYMWRRVIAPRACIKPLLIGAIVFIVVSLWWPLAVAITPVADRPYIGSTTDNSPWSLLFGYNGFGRIGASQQIAQQATYIGAQFGGESGPLRLLNAEFAPLIAWFLPMIFPVGLALWRKKSLKQEHHLLSVSMFIVGIYSVLFSFMGGIVHPYYVVIVAPFLAIIAAYGLRYAIDWYLARHQRLRYVLPITLLLMALLSAFYLNYDGAPLAVFGPSMIILGIVWVGVLFVGREHTWNKRLLWAGSICIIAIAPATQTLASLTRPHEGPYPSTYNTRIRGEKISAKAFEYIRVHSSGDTEWIAITESAYYAAPLQLALGRPVLTLGGFNGTDPRLSLAELQSYVASNRVRYFVASPLLPRTLPEKIAWLARHTLVYKDDTAAIYDLKK